MSQTASISEKEIAHCLAANPQVTLAWLFGSFSRGRARPDSDVDIAVYLKTPYSPADIRTLWNQLEDLTQREVDLVVVNNAPPGIAWSAMKGRVLVNKNPRLAIELMLDKSREAEDFRQFQLAFIRERYQHWRVTHGPVDP